MKHTGHHEKWMQLAMLLLALFLCGTTAFAQTDRSIIGTVVDENGTPLPAAHIVQLPSTTDTKGAATITDIHGVFGMKLLPAAKQIKVSFLGYKDKIVTLTDDDKHYNIRMEPVNELLDEVVVTGYQTISRERATGSFAKLSNEKLESVRLNSLSTLLEGRVAGYTNGKIRGVTSMQGMTTPLYVVDGFPIENTRYRDGGWSIEEDYRDIIEDPDYIEYAIPSPMDHYYVENYNFRHGMSSYYSSEYPISVERAAQFEAGDTRMAARWKHYDIGLGAFYRGNMDGYYNYSGMTTVEVCLIKAECLARSGAIDEAMDVLNAVRITRILPDYYQPLTATTEAEAMAYIMRTKNNEMLKTQVPFNDARRLNAEGKYPVTLSKEVDGVTLTLSPTSHLWTMPFPQEAIKYHGNGTITQNVDK